MLTFSLITVTLLLLITRSSSDSVPLLRERNLETWTPCATESCNSRQECVPDEQNAMVCACKLGWTGSRCSDDLDECATMDACSFPGGYCQDRHPNEGRYACGCVTKGNHWRNSTNSSSFNEHGSTECMDVDECTELDSPCVPNATCTNTFGSYMCECDHPFQGDGFSLCEVPVNQTDEELLPSCEDGQCDLANSFCDMDIYPSKCRCLFGFFAGSLGLSCQDENECEVDERNHCHENAACTNSVGSYSCECMKGYKDVSPTGNGTVCQQIDECTEGGNDCDELKDLCIDLTPPDMWECIPITSEPSSVPSLISPSANPSSNPTIDNFPSNSPSVTPSATPTLIPMPPTSLVLNLNSDGFGEETSYRLYDVVNEQLLWSERSVLKNSQIQEEIVLDPRGCYFFLVHDLFVDGICCSFGNGSARLTFGGDAVELSEFESSVLNGNDFTHMAHAYIGLGCDDVPFLPSALDSSCDSQCGSIDLQASGCSCDCIMTDSRRSRNGEVAVGFGDCCPDYVAMCTSTAAPLNAGPSGQLEISYKKSSDGTLPTITLFDMKGAIGSGSCDTPAGCEISIVMDSAGLICSELFLRIEEDSAAWIFAEDVVLTVTLDGNYVLNYEGNIFPSILSFDCSVFS